VLDAAGFQNLPIPQELDRTPAELQRDLDAQRESIDAQRKTLLETLARWSEPFAGPLLEARRTLMLAEPLVSLDPSIRSAGYLAYLAGWVPARSVERSTHGCAIAEPSLRDERAQPDGGGARAGPDGPGEELAPRPSPCW
jgi:vacuolar-type H+-ATPase subunit I/STV1